MGKWKLRPGARMVRRDDAGVLIVHRGGDEVELSAEQEQRLRPGQRGSAFVEAGSEDEQPELVEVAVANEATLPAEDGSAPASPAGTRNRKVAATRLPAAEQESVDDQTRAGSESADVPEPSTSTEPKRTTGRK